MFSILFISYVQLWFTGLCVCVLCVCVCVCVCGVCVCVCAYVCGVCVCMYVCVCVCVRVWVCVRYINDIAHSFTLSSSGDSCGLGDGSPLNLNALPAGIYIMSLNRQ